MPASRKAAAPVADRIRTELQLIRANVTGVHRSLAATSDGLPVAYDLPDLEPTEISALVATTHALASRATLATGRGQFREAVAAAAGVTWPCTRLGPAPSWPSSGPAG
jgi:predicted regulator of Ras-like GTPase activity (Roadblock/LC7/MglB family)